jgi:hypothetical protein
VQGKGKLRSTRMCLLTRMAPDEQATLQTIYRGLSGAAGHAAVVALFSKRVDVGGVQVASCWCWGHYKGTTRPGALTDWQVYAGSHIDSGTCVGFGCRQTTLRQRTK